MEIYQLRAFLTVASTGHLTRAAEILNLTQPTVSKQVKALEDELGVTLFERTSSGMTITKPGELLLEHARKTLSNALDLVNTAKKMQGEVAGTVRLGTIIDPDYIRLGMLLRRIVSFYPKMEIRLAHGISGSIMEQVAARKLDCGFYLGEVDDPAMCTLRLSTLTYLVVAPPAWAGKIAEAGWQEVAAMPWVGTPVYSSQHRLVREMFQEYGGELTTVAEADQESSMASLVKMGVGLCLLRNDVAMAAQGKGELIIWDKIEQHCALSFIYLKSCSSDVGVNALLGVVKDVWGIDDMKA